MEKKKLTILVSICIVLLCLVSLMLLKAGNKSDKVVRDIVKSDVEVVQQSEDGSDKKETVNKKNEIKNNDSKVVSEASNTTVKKNKMYDNYSSGAVPLSAICITAEQPKYVKDSVSKIVENFNSIYMVKNTGSKLLVIVDNPNNIRHGLILWKSL